nr:MAG: hypothetical protein J07AB56_12940 [Candidatus Nanosalinarum sp. J07AB56]
MWLNRIVEEVEWDLAQLSKNSHRTGTEINQQIPGQQHISIHLERVQKLSKKLYTDYLESKTEDIDGEDLQNPSP